MYPPNNYNWYSTKENQQKYEQQQTNETRRTRYSDAGRYPLGNFSDAENVEFRKRSIGSVSQETIKRWKDFQTELREQCSLRKVTKVEKIDEKLKTFPKKKSELENIDDFPSHYDRSKYKFVRRVDDDSQSASGASGSEVVDDDCQIIKVTSRASSEDKENAPAPKIIEEASEKRSSDKTDDSIFVVTEGEKDEITPMDCHVITEIATSSSPQKENSPPEITPATPEKEPTPVTPPPPPSPKTMTPECILHKYGHCFSPRTCPFVHNGGSLQKVGR